MVAKDMCPGCGSAQFKKNGHLHRGQQNHQCKACGRQFAASAEARLISDERRTLIEHLLRERISLRGVCRAVGISRTGLLHFMVERCAACHEHLHVQLPAGPTDVVLRRLESEADETWSFVQTKADRQWIWIAMDAQTRQVLAFYVGDRSRGSAKALWTKIPWVSREQAILHAAAHLSPGPRHAVVL